MLKKEGLYWSLFLPCFISGHVTLLTLVESLRSSRRVLKKRSSPVQVSSHELDSWDTKVVQIHKQIIWLHIVLKDTKNTSTTASAGLLRIYLFISIYYVFPFPGKWRLSTDKGENYLLLYAVWVQYLAKTQIYCGKKVIDELTRDPDSLASVQETLKNVVLHITSRKMHANVDVLLKTVNLLICWVYRHTFGF